jgi:hypothetical protein
MYLKTCTCCNDILLSVLSRLLLAAGLSYRKMHILTNSSLSLLFAYIGSLELSARQVMEFCSDCVLSESEDVPCVIPEAFFKDDEPVESKLQLSP